jgi:Fe2+-dicitrate sensor, membrane component
MSEQSNDIDREATDWVARQASGRIEPSDQIALDAWLSADRRHRGAFLRARALWHRLNDASVVSTLNGEIAGDNAVNIGNPSDFLTKRRTPVQRRVVIGGAVAAGIGALLFWGTKPRGELIETGPAEFRRVSLSDSSIAQLNSSSMVRVAMTPSERQISLLAGEAWFDVAKNPQRPFVVSAGAVRVRAVGTSFSVRKATSGTEIIVSSGTVQIWDQESNQPKRLATANDIAFVSSGSGRIIVTSSPRDAVRKLAWRDGNIVLDDQSLEQAVAVFNRYNTNQIVIRDPELRQKRLVGIYRLDQPEEFARDVQELLHVPVRVSNGSIVIG